MGVVTANTNQSGASAVRQLSDGNPNGTVLGDLLNSQGTGDKIAFFGSTAPVVQPAGVAQAAITRGVSCGVIATYMTLQTPSIITANSAVEQTFTVMPVTTSGPVIPALGDLIFINKGSVGQAGMGIGNVRVSAANSVGITFNNSCGTTITPSASDSYPLVLMRGFNVLTQTITPSAIVSSTCVEQQFTVTGVRAGDLVIANRTAGVVGGVDIAGVRAVGNNTIGINFANFGLVTTALPIASSTVSIISLGGIDAVNNEVMWQISSLTPASVATTSTAQLPLTISNAAITDFITGVYKPTLQAGLAMLSARVSAAGTVASLWANITIPGALTPTANELYAFAVKRPNPVAPMILLSQTLTPASVVSQTTAEQTFTVTGLVANQPVFINKPSAQPGLGIVGARTSTTNTLAIQYCNPTANAITPATETYLIGQFQIPADIQGNSIIQTAAQVSQGQSILANAIRSALASTSLNLIAGA
jgi:hypothetical protein